MFELAVEGWQAEEAILAIFHPVLFHRTTGKFTYQVSFFPLWDAFKQIFSQIFSPTRYLSSFFGMLSNKYFQRESSYSVGTVGYEDVDCDCIDHTYVR